MSPPASDVPHTPDRKSSSSTLFAAFKNLATGRIRSPAPHSPSPSANAPINSHSLRHGGRAVSGPVSASGETSEGAHTIHSENVVSSGRRSISAVPIGHAVGGPPELGDLLDRLDRQRPVPDRITAAHQLCAVLNDYRVSNVLAVWAVASDLLSVSEPPGAPEAGYALLSQCVKLPDLTPLQRSFFFQVLSDAQDGNNFDVRFHILAELTSNGRNVDAFETSIGPLLTASLQKCYDAAIAARRKRTRSDREVREEATLSLVFQYIVNIIRFNTKVFPVPELETLLNQVIRICKTTPKHEDIERSIEIFDAVITYTQIPRDSLVPCMEILCDIHRQLKGLESQTWRALRNLFKSHMGRLSINALLDIVSCTSSRPQGKKNTIRGALHALSKILLLDGEEGLPTISISLLISALKSSLQADDRKLEVDILTLFANILADGNLSKLLLQQEDWCDIVDVIYQCAYDEDVRGIGDEEPSAEGVDPCSASSRQATNDTILTRSEEALSNVLQGLEPMLDQMDFVQKSSVMGLFLRLGSRIDATIAESLVCYYAEQRLLLPPNEKWLETCQALMNAIFQNHSRPQELRLHVLSVVQSVLSTVQHIVPMKQVISCANIILENIPEEWDPIVLKALVGSAIDVSQWASYDFFDGVVGFVHGVFHTPRSAFSSVACPLEDPDSLDRSSGGLGSLHNVATQAIVRMFLRSLNTSARKSECLYDILLRVAGNESLEIDARLSALKLLFRLRADAGFAVLVESEIECQSIAAVLCRTGDTAIPGEPAGSVSHQHRRSEDTVQRREARSSFSISPHVSISRLNLRHQARLQRPTQPLWLYPDSDGLPEEPSKSPSSLLCCHTTLKADDAGAPHLLCVGLWLELLISILQKGSDWEIYSYILAHLPAQLANRSLFSGTVPQIQMLRNVLCEQARAATFHEPPSSSGLKKADVAVCIIHILTMLISYHAYFEKSEEDEMVRSFLLGIGTWDNAPKWCIHALAVCCHEIPLSTSKHLDNIIQKMSQIVTQSQIAIHILEFLACLARLPNLYKNFREDEYKMVFGVSFRYLQYVRDQRERASAQAASRAGQGTLRHSGPSRDFATIVEQDQRPRVKSPSDELPQYVYALAFHVITFWFMALKIQDRPKYMEWICRNLIYIDRTGNEIIDEQSEVTIDMMQRVAWSDRDETAPNKNFATSFDGEISQKAWIVGVSLMTIETAGRTGVSQITSRRPSGTRYSVLRPQLIKPPETSVGILPDDIYQEFYAPLNERPVVLPSDDTTRRAVNSFDRISTVDGHKVGVIYIGDGQTLEADIFANTMGSPDYTTFIHKLGTVTKLRGATFNTQGLDRQDNSDGEFTICWRDRVTELVFHVTTMMPTNLDHDPQCINKKRHTGNDFVNIVFNDSGIPFKFDMFPSAFNYVYIVITPEARTSFLHGRTSTRRNDRFYKVQVMGKPDFPEISTAAEAKVVSGKSLPSFVRLLAINASVFSLVWASMDGGEFISPWRSRLREIKRLREKHCGQMSSTSMSPSLGSGGHGHGHGGSPHTTSPPARDSAVGFKRTSVATFISEGTSRSSLLSNSQEMERQGPDPSRG